MAEENNEPQDAFAPGTDEPKDGAFAPEYTFVLDASDNDGDDQDADEPEEEKRGFSGREKVLTGVAAVAVVAAIAGFGLFAVNSVPSNVAAKYDGGVITEEEVASSIAQYRSAYGFTDDSTFATQLESQNMTVASYRQNTADQLIIANLVEKRAKELGIEVSDDEVNEKVQQIAGQISSGDDSMWQSTLESMGITEEALQKRYHADLLQQKVCEQDVAVTDATDDEALTYIQTYLSDSTQKLVYRIVFTSDDGKTKKSDECYKKLKALKDAGKLTTKKFSEIAAEYSESDTVSSDKGELGWTGSGNISSDISDAIEDMKKGGVSEPVTVEDDDNALEVVFVADVCKFPSSDNMDSLDSLNVPDELLSIIKSAAAQSVWQSNSTKYLAKLLADAKVTYYPVPDDAAYNVSLD